jgi:predicted DNA binding CopG/RHH family protein
MNKYDPKYIDEEEKELMETIEQIDTNTIRKPTKERQLEIKKAAKEFIKNEKKMNIRIDPYELKKIKEHAAREGLKYQTFIKSVVHKYITGQLIDKDKIAG